MTFYRYCSLRSNAQNEGTRMIKRSILRYSLDMIISVGYRVKFRRVILFQKKPIKKRSSLNVF